MKRSIITGTGKFVPHKIVENKEFAEHIFYTDDRRPIDAAPELIAQKFLQITGIEERRYAEPSLTASDMAVEAARLAITDSGADPETIDQLIVAHNYGNIHMGGIQSDTVPSLASRVKHALGIRNPSCVAYDLLFGCPGWLQGIIQSDLFCKAGAAQKCLVVGTETLSRVIDLHDRDSMIFADGAGAALLEYRETPEDGSGVLGTAVRSDCIDELAYIDFGPSYFPDADPHHRYIKMKGRKVYEYAISRVPAAMKDCMDRCGIPIGDLKKIFIHQANEKMDEVIVRNFYKLYGEENIPANIMPMSIRWLGNSSVATIPTLYDMVIKNELPEHRLERGDIILFASVGAGMNINAVCYRY